MDSALNLAMAILCFLITFLIVVLIIPRKGD